MYKKALFVLAILVMTPSLGQASVTLNMQLGFLQDGGGTPLSTGLTPPGATIVLVADTGMDGFGDATNPQNGFGGDANDVAFYHGELNGFLGGAGTHFESVIIPNVTGLAGKQIKLYWYDQPFDALDTGPDNNVDFGMFRTDNVENGSSIAWVMPNDGKTESLNFKTTNLAGDQPESAGLANMTTNIPEPGSLAVFAAGCALLASRPRKRNTA